MINRRTDKCTFPDCECMPVPPCPHYAHEPSATKKPPEQLDRMREALEPFAKLAEYVVEGHKLSRPAVYGFDHHILERLTIGDFCRAALALSADDQSGAA